jgi:thiamine-phosphate pyrophosphorylase
MVQLREKEMEAGLILKYAETVRARTSEFNALFIVNDRVDLAIAAGADGVHLGQDDLPVKVARPQLGSDLLIGLSTHSHDQIEASGSASADYIGIGPIHPTPTKPGRSPVGYKLITHASQSSPLPFFAIGGIDLTNIKEVIEAGARRVSVLRALTEAEDPAAIARKLKKALESAQ